VEDHFLQLQAVLASPQAKRLLKQALRAMKEPPKAADWMEASALGWHMGACLVLAEGLMLWLGAELWGCGEWTEPAVRPAWDDNPNRFYHHGYWDFVDHVLVASGEYLIDAGGIYPQADPSAVVAWWQEEFGPCIKGIRPLAGLKVSMEEEGIRRSPVVSQALAKLLEQELGSGATWREELANSELTLA
jgi:hypothetical protein